jgi:hypothetical protein
MKLEDALKIITEDLAPRTLSNLQIDVFRGAWNKQSYTKISLELNHEYSYIKDVGADLWQLLTRELGIRVTKLNLQDALTGYALTRQPFEQPALLWSKRVDWGEAPDVSDFYGRQAELNSLEEWVLQDHCRLVAIAGMGGIGKTILATKLAQQLAEQFEVVVWRSLWQAPPMLALLRELLTAITPQQSLPLQLDASLRQLLEQLRYHRCLLILDHTESILSSGEFAGAYKPGYEDYEWLFQQLGSGRHQSSILLTSREIPAEITIQSGLTTPVRVLRLDQISIQDGQAILAAKGLSQTTEPSQIRELVEYYQGNPLALKIVATPIQDLYGGNIVAFLAEETRLFKDIRDLVAHQFNRLSDLEQQVMNWLTINREAVTATQLMMDLTPSVSHAQLLDALVSLDQRSLLVKVDSASYTQQPMIMEYVTERLIEQVCQELEQAQMDCLQNYTLIKPQAKAYVRDMQVRLIVQPILTQLIESQGGRENLKHRLLQLLKIQQSQAPSQPGYFAINATTLLAQLESKLSDQDFFNLRTKQADSQIEKLQEINFNYKDRHHLTFRPALSVADSLDLTG